MITRRFYAVIVQSGEYIQSVAAIEEQSFQQRENLTHVRADYSALQAAAVASWLNEREAGYPVPEKLEHLYVSTREATLTDGQA